MKVLTFVDMSHLGYLSRSVKNESVLTRHTKQKKALPRNTESAIIEDEIEDSSDGEETKKNSLALSKTESQIFSEQSDFARTLIDEILTIVVESADHNAVIEQNEIITNSLIKKNINKIHKQVFVKMKDHDGPAFKKPVPKKQTKSFAQLKENRLARQKG